MSDLFEEKDISPMLLGEEKQPFDDPDYIYELKLDGIRCIAYLEKGKVTLRNKRNKDITALYPELAHTYKCAKKRCILDGELVVFTGSKPDFYAVQRRSLMTDGFKIGIVSRQNAVAQSESENISANVRWGKEQSAKQGKVAFQYKNFLGYKKGEDGKPVIDIEQADVVKFIYDRYLAGDSLKEITKKLMDLKISTPLGKQHWSCSTVRSILTNEKYKGDAIINKTFVVDCISKRVKVNNGERKKYYVENNHPAIVDAATFAKVQEEIARRSGKKKIKQVGTKTELGKYCGKYALTERLICGECKTPYRRCTWTVKGKKKIVWRCINRLDYGKKYCHNSPTIDENVLHDAIMAAIQQTAQQNMDTLQTLKTHIGVALGAAEKEENTVEIEFRIAQIDAEFKSMIDTVSADTVDGLDESRIQQLIAEKNELQAKLGEITEERGRQQMVQDRLETIYTVLDGLKNRPMTYDDEVVRQLIDCVVVESKDRIKVIFCGGLQVEQQLRQEDMDFLSEMGPLVMH